MLDFKGMNPVQIRRVLTLIACFQNISVADLLAELVTRGAPELAYGALSKRKDFPLPFRLHLGEFVQTLKPHEQVFLHLEMNQKRVEGLAPEDVVRGSEVLRALDSWFKLRPTENRLATHCTNSNGHFLVLRLLGDKRLSISRMRIMFRTPDAWIPAFLTARINDSGKIDKVVRGCIFESGLTVYAMGQIKDDPGLRFSRLSYVRHLGRTDLYGLRCGHSSETNRPFAHLIYAYQLKKGGGALVNKLARAHDSNDPLLHKHIEGFSRILELLDAPTLLQGGLQPHAVNS